MILLSYAKTPNQKEGMTREILRKLLLHWLGPALDNGTFKEWRAAWVETILFNTQVRIGDLRRLTVAHLTFTDHGLDVFYPKRKNDQVGEGHKVNIISTGGFWCPVKLTRSYLTALEIQNSPHAYVVPAIVKAGAEWIVSPYVVGSYGTCYSAQKAALAAVGEDPAKFAMHSSRVGSTKALKAQPFLRWTSPVGAAGLQGANPPLGT